jgi:hypothetical protein
MLRAREAQCGALELMIYSLAEDGRFSPHSLRAAFVLSEYPFPASEDSATDPRPAVAGRRPLSPNCPSASGHVEPQRSR